MDSPATTPQKDNRKIWYGTLIALLLGTWGYIIYDKNQTKEVIAQKDTQFVTVRSAKDSLQMLFNNASARVDSITESNVKMQGSLAEKNNDILKLKSNIRSILNKKDASDAELKQAQAMIAELNGKIDDLSAQVAQLKGENQQLTTANQQLSTEKRGLQDSLSTSQTQNKGLQTENSNLNDKVEVASTLQASNINVAAINVKKNGKEKQTSNVKRADMFVITGDLSSNRVTTTGKKTVYVVVHNPDGTVSAPEGSLTLRDGSTTSYTNKVDVDYEQGKTSQLNFSWKPGDKFVTGDYKIEVYNNGFKIGQAQKSLKKSWL